MLTGLNDAFIIDGKIKDRLIVQDLRSAEIIRPILRGRDIKRYGYTFADKWLIATHNGYEDVPRIDVNDYPAVKNWLDAFKNKLSKRSDKGATLYNLRDCAYWSLFAQPKIIWPRLTRISRQGGETTFPRFALINEPMYTIDSLCIMTGLSLTFLISVLNSVYAAYWFFNNVPILDNGGLQMRQQFIENIPIPKEFLRSTPKGAISDTSLCNAFHFTTVEQTLIAEKVAEKLRVIANVRG